MHHDGVSLAKRSRTVIASNTIMRCASRRTPV